MQFGKQYYDSSFCLKPHHPYYATLVLKMESQLIVGRNQASPSNVVRTSFCEISRIVTMNAITLNSPFISCSFESGVSSDYYCFYNL
mmetsp:Transcript_25061/g.41589  ORF Transcript_25061/g.41589 Transcript_25061/m.41589 type:complete len:87 (-) Transcript_25061:106-366(-)